MRTRLLLFDVLAVFTFVVVGRANHGQSETLPSILHTVGPFLLALGAGWLLSRAWQQPETLGTGVVVAFTTVAGGLAFRRTLFGEGTALSFVIVATVVLSVLLLGWRLAATLRQRSRSGVLDLK